MATRKTKTSDTPEAAPAEVKKPRRAAAPKVAEVTQAAPATAPKRARKPKAESTTESATESVAESVAEMVPEQASVVHHEERHRHVSEAAYYLAERRGFTPGNEHDDWLQAEAEVAAKLKG